MELIALLQVYPNLETTNKKPTLCTSLEPYSLMWRNVKKSLTIVRIILPGCGEILPGI